MKVFRFTFRRRLRLLVVLSALILLLLIFNYTRKESGFPKEPTLPCSHPDDPGCPTPQHRFASLPPTKKLPTLDAGAQWCRDAELERPRFPGDREPQAWQAVGHSNVTVFSAFVDDRRRIGGPLIRIISTGLQEKFNHVGTLFCTLWYEDNDVPVTVGPAMYDLIYPSTMFPEMWVAHFIICPMPVNGNLGVPYAVSVTGKSCEAASNALMILNRQPGPIGDFTFAVCFPPVYGKSLDWPVFIEWIELNKILGMTSAYFYNFSMDPSVNKVFAGYQKNHTENVNVVQWHIPGNNLINYFSQHSAINDCLYRAGHSHRFVAVMDMDEIFAPRQHETWTDMMRSMFHPDIGAYLFQHAYFRRNTTGEQLYLITQQSLWRTDVVYPVGKIRCKAMYLASNAIKANIHFPYALLDQAREEIVAPDFAMLHHYRIEPMETFRKHPEQFRFIEDNHLRKYNDRLKRAVLKRMQDFDMSNDNLAPVGLQ